MLAELKELWRFRELLFSSVYRELQIRYKNSFLGIFWSLLNPLITVIVMTFVLGIMNPTAPPNFGAYVLAAYLPYMAFQLTLMDSAQSVVGSLGLIKKIYFPREILPLSIIFANFIHFLISLVAFFGFLLFVWVKSLLLDESPVSPFQFNTIYLPILLVIQLAMMTGFGLMISALNTFYEDVKYLLGVILYLLFFLSPIMYFSERAEAHFARYGEAAKYIYYANPVAGLVTCYRKMLLAPQEVAPGQRAAELSWKLMGVTGIGSIVILIAGYYVFNRLKWRFVERP